MATINQLSTAGSISNGDLMALYSTDNGDSRKVSMSVLKDFFSTSETGDIIQYSAPSSTGFTTTIQDTDNNVWLILTPTTTMATGTIVLPTSPIDNQEVLINSTNEVTALTVNGGDYTITGEPSTLVANGFFKLKFNVIVGTWYRIG